MSNLNLRILERNLKQKTIEFDELGKQLLILKSQFSLKLSAGDYDSAQVLAKWQVKCSNLEGSILKLQGEVVRLREEKQELVLKVEQNIAQMQLTLPESHSVLVQRMHKAEQDSFVLKAKNEEYTSVVKMLKTLLSDTLPAQSVDAAEQVGVLQARCAQLDRVLAQAIKERDQLRAAQRDQEAWKRKVVHELQSKLFSLENSVEATTKEHEQQVADLNVQIAQRDETIAYLESVNQFYDNAQDGAMDGNLDRSLDGDVDGNADASVPPQPELLHSGKIAADSTRRPASIRTATEADQYSTLSRDKMDVDEQLQYLQAELTATSEGFEHLMIERDELQNKIIQIQRARQDDMNQYEQRIKMLTGRIELLTENRTTTEQQVQAVSTVSDKDCQAQSDASDQLSQTSEPFTQTLGKLEDSLKLTLAERDELLSKLTTTRESLGMQNELQDRLDKATLQLRILTLRESEARDECAAIKKEMVTIQRTQTVNSDCISANIAAKPEDLQASITTLVERCDQLNASNVSLQAQLESAKRELQSVASNKEKFETLLAASVAEKQNLEFKNSTLKAEKGLLQTKIGSLERLADSYDDLRQKHEVAEVEIQKLENNYFALQGKMTGTPGSSTLHSVSDQGSEGSFDGDKERVSQLESAVEEKERMVSLLPHQVGDLEKSKADQAKIVQELEKKLADSSEQQEKLLQQIAVLNGSVNDLEQEKRGTQAAAAQLQTKIQTLEAELDQLKSNQAAELNPADLTAMRSEHAQIVANLTKQHEEEVSELTAQHEARIQGMHDEVASLYQELATAQSQSKSTESILNETKAKLDTVCGTLTVAESEKQALFKSMQDTQAKLVESRSQMDGMKTRITALEKAEEQLSVELDQLRARSKREIDDEINTTQQVEKENQQLKDKLSNMETELLHLRTHDKQFLF